MSLGKPKRLTETYQCDNCLEFFEKKDVVKKCACGAYLCKACEEKGINVVCYCSV